MKHEVPNSVQPSTLIAQRRPPDIRIQGVVSTRLKIDIGAQEAIVTQNGPMICFTQKVGFRPSMPSVLTVTQASTPQFRET